jgi:hypothetical protein
VTVAGRGKIFAFHCRKLLFTQKRHLLGEKACHKGWGLK